MVLVERRIIFCDLVDHFADVSNRGVDFPTGGIALERPTQFGKRLATRAHFAQNTHGRDEAAVCSVVVGEVIVSRVLTSKDGASLGHDLLHVTVTIFCSDCDAAKFADYFRDCARANEVVQDGCTGIEPQKS